MHNTQVIGAMDESESVAKLVDCLLDKSDIEKILVGPQAVEFFMKSVRRDDRRFSLELCLTEDIRENRHEKIAAGDAENFAVNASEFFEQGR